MDAAQCHSHPADLDRQRITSGKYPAIGQRHPRACIKAKRLQPLRFFGNQR